jgi:hypothetical protein
LWHVSATNLRLDRPGAAGAIRMSQIALLFTRAGLAARLILAVSVAVYEESEGQDQEADAVPDAI